MSTPSQFTNWAPEGNGTQLPPGDTLPQTAQSGLGDILMFDASGNAAPTDGATTGLVSAGVSHPARLSPTQTTGAKVMAWFGFGRLNTSTVSADAATVASQGVPVFAATQTAGVATQTVGIKSNIAGVGRPLVGLAFGLYEDGSTRVWSGPVASLIARVALLLGAFPLASFGVADAAASTAIAERAVRRVPVKGTVTSVTYTGSALVVGDTDYVTVSIAKRDGAGGGAVVLATYDSRAAGNGAATAFIPKSLTLSVVSGALYLLETDVVTITTVKGGSGQVLTGEFSINGKAGL